jgi:hypothetical protein
MIKNRTTFVTSLLGLGPRKFVTLMGMCESSSHWLVSVKVRSFNSARSRTRNIGHHCCFTQGGTDNRLIGIVRHRLMSDSIAELLENGGSQWTPTPCRVPLDINGSNSNNFSRADWKPLEQVMDAHSSPIA